MRPGPIVAADAAQLIAQVRTQGDAALLALTERFDGVRLDRLPVSAAEFAAARAKLTPLQHTALERASENVEKFHAAQQLQPLSVETTPGVRCERIVRAINTVGLYVPAGSAPLPSAVIMLAVPARLAGCPQRVLCTPPARDGGANPAVLVAAQLCGIDTVFKVGGAQAIAALGLRHGLDTQGRQDLRARQRLGDCRQATGLRLIRTARPWTCPRARPRYWSSLMRPQGRLLWPRIYSHRPNTIRSPRRFC